MAWKDIPGRAGWQFNDAPALPTKNYLSRQTSRNRQVNTVGGVRTEQGRQVYAQTRYSGDPTDLGFSRGEISATHANAKVGVTGVQNTAYYAALGGGGGPVVDPFWNSVTLLVRKDDTTNDALDVSNAGNTLSEFIGGISWNDADKPGGAWTPSLDANSAAQDQRVWNNNYGPGVAFGTGDYTIDFWYKSSTIDQVRLFDQNTTTNGGFILWIDNSVIKYNENGGTNAIGSLGTKIGTTNVNDGQWHFIAITRSSGTTTVWLDGQVEITFASTIGMTGEAISINPGLTNLSPRLLNDFRITKGVARYSAPFAVPTGPFATS